MKDQPMSEPQSPKEQSTTATWILVISVLSVVIFTFIAAAALYLLVGGIISNDLTPPGNLEFAESSTESGLYTGRFTTLSRTVLLADVSLTITDISLGESGLLDPLVDSGTVVISSGLRCSFSDVNQNVKLDTDDIFRIEDGDPGDIMRFIYKPTGGTIATYTFS